MAKFIDLDRDRQERILVNWRASLLAIEALSAATGRPFEVVVKEIVKQANDRVDGCNELQLRVAMETLDAEYD